MNVKIDSRKIEKGDTFVALRGIDHDGHAYIRQAIENGAAKIICEEGSYEVETCIVEDTRAYLVNYLKDTYYDKISKLKLIGITGTNGKTTSAFLLHQMLNKLGKNVAILAQSASTSARRSAVSRTRPPISMICTRFCCNACRSAVSMLSWK